MTQETIDCIREHFPLNIKFSENHERPEKFERRGWKSEDDKVMFFSDRPEGSCNAQTYLIVNFRNIYDKLEPEQRKELPSLLGIE